MMEPLNGPEQRIGQREVAGDTFLTAFVQTYHALERLPHEQRRRVINAVQALLPSDPNAIGMLQPRDYLRVGIISPDQELKQRQYAEQRDARLGCGEPGCVPCDPFTTGPPSDTFNTSQQGSLRR